MLERYGLLQEAYRAKGGMHGGSGGNVLTGWVLIPETGKGMRRVLRRLADADSACKTPSPETELLLLDEPTNHWILKRETG